MNVAKHVARMGLGGTRVSRVDDPECFRGRELPSGFFALGAGEIQRKVRFGVTPKPARETRALARASVRDFIVHA